MGTENGNGKSKMILWILGTFLIPFALVCITWGALTANQKNDRTNFLEEKTINSRDHEVIRDDVKELIKIFNGYAVENNKILTEIKVEQGKQMVELQAIKRNHRNDN